MTLMRIREITSCRNHARTTIVLEDPGQELMLTFYADVEEARRLTREIARSGCACHPIYDFVQSFLLAPGRSRDRDVPATRSTTSSSRSCSRSTRT